MAKTLRQLTSAGFDTKGSALTYPEVDTNFIELKGEIDAVANALTAASVVPTGAIVLGADGTRAVVDSVVTIAAGVVSGVVTLNAGAANFTSHVGLTDNQQIRLGNDIDGRVSSTSGRIHYDVLTEWRLRSQVPENMIRALVGGEVELSHNAVVRLATTAEGISITSIVALGGGLRLKGYTSAAADPTTTELPADKDCAIHKNTSSGDVFLAFNDGGSTIKKVLLA